MNITLAYEILQVSENISDEELKKKFKSLVLKYHPDRNKEQDTTKKFIEITDAYNAVLKDRKQLTKTWADDFVNTNSQRDQNFRSSQWTFTFSDG